MVTLRPFDKNGCIVPHLKDLFHICLEPENQGHGMIFMVWNFGSKQPHLYSAYVVSIAFQSHTTVHSQSFSKITQKGEEIEPSYENKSFYPSPKQSKARRREI